MDRYNLVAQFKFVADKATLGTIDRITDSLEKLQSQVSRPSPTFQVKGIEDVVRQTDKLSSSTTVATNAVKKFSRKTAVEQSKAVDSMSRSTQELRKEYTALSSRMSAIDFSDSKQNFKAVRAEVNATIEGLSRLEAEIKGVNAEERKLKSDIGGKKAKLTSRLDSRTKEEDMFSKAGTATVVNELSNATSAANAFIQSIGSDAVQTFADFDESMAGVGAISRANAKDLKDMRDLAAKMGAETQFTAKQAADAEQFLAMAGFNVASVLEALPATLSLAAAGGLDLATSADIASNVLSAFNLKAGETAHVADVLAITAATANTSVAQLGEGFAYAAPAAKAYGITMEELAGLFSAAGNVGIQASSAGTAFRAGLINLTSASKQGILSSMGVEAVDATGKLNSTINILGQLRDTLGTDAFRAGGKGEGFAAEYQKILDESGDISDAQVQALEAKYQMNSVALDKLSKVFGKTAISAWLGSLSQFEIVQAQTYRAMGSSVDDGLMADQIRKQLGMDEGTFKAAMAEVKGDAYALVTKYAKGDTSAEKSDNAMATVQRSLLNLMDESLAISEHKEAFINEITRQIGTKFGVSQGDFMAVVEQMGGYSEAVQSYTHDLSATKDILRQSGVDLNKGSKGAAALMQQVQNNNLAGTFKELDSALEGLQIAVIEPISGLIRGIAKLLTFIASTLAHLPGPIRTVISTTALLTAGLIAAAAAMGPLLAVWANYRAGMAASRLVTQQLQGTVLSTANAMSFTQSSLATAFDFRETKSAFRVFQTKAGAMFKVLSQQALQFASIGRAAILSPFGLTTLAIIGVYLVLETLTKNFNFLGSAMNLVFGPFVYLGGFLLGFVRSAINGVIEVLQELFHVTVGSPVQSVMASFAEGIAHLARRFKDGQSAGEAAFKAITDGVSAAIQTARMFGGILLAMGSQMGGAYLFTLFQNLGSSLNSLFGQFDFSGVTGAFTAIAAGAYWLRDLLVSLLNHGASDVVTAAWVRARDNIFGVFKFLAAQAWRTGVAIVEGITGSLQIATSFLMGLMGSFLEEINPVASIVKKALTGAFFTVAKAVQPAFMTVFRLLSGQALQAARWILAGISQGLQVGLPTIWADLAPTLAILAPWIALARGIIVGAFLGIGNAIPSFAIALTALTTFAFVLIKWGKLVLDLATRITQIPAALGFVDLQAQINNAFPALAKFSNLLAKAFSVDSVGLKAIVAGGLKLAAVAVGTLGVDIWAGLTSSESRSAFIDSMKGIWTRAVADFWPIISDFVFRIVSYIKSTFAWLKEALFGYFQNFDLSSIFLMSAATVAASFATMFDFTRIDSLLKGNLQLSGFSDSVITFSKSLSTGKISIAELATAILEMKSLVFPILTSLPLLAAIAISTGFDKVIWHSLQNLQETFDLGFAKVRGFVTGTTSLFVQMANTLSGKELISTASLDSTLVKVNAVFDQLYINLTKFFASTKGIRDSIANAIDISGLGGVFTRLQEQYKKFSEGFSNGFFGPTIEGMGIFSDPKFFQEMLGFIFLLPVTKIVEGAKMLLEGEVGQLGAQVLRSLISIATSISGVVSRSFLAALSFLGSIYETALVEGFARAYATFREYLLAKVIGLPADVIPGAKLTSEIQRFLFTPIGKALGQVAVGAGGAAETVGVVVTKAVEKSLSGFYGLIERVFGPNAVTAIKATFAYIRSNIIGPATKIFGSIGQFAVAAIEQSGLKGVFLSLIEGISVFISAPGKFFEIILKNLRAVGTVMRLLMNPMEFMRLFFLTKGFLPFTSAIGPLDVIVSSFNSLGLAIISNSALARKLSNFLGSNLDFVGLKIMNLKNVSGGVVSQLIGALRLSKGWLSVVWKLTEALLGGLSAWAQIGLGIVSVTFIIYGLAKAFDDAWFESRKITVDEGSRWASVIGVYNSAVGAVQKFRGSIVLVGDSIGAAFRTVRAIMVAIPIVAGVAYKIVFGILHAIAWGFDLVLRIPLVIVGAVGRAVTSIAAIIFSAIPSLFSRFKREIFELADVSEMYTGMVNKSLSGITPKILIDKALPIISSLVREIGLLIVSGIIGAAAIALTGITGFIAWPLALLASGIVAAFMFGLGGVKKYALQTFADILSIVTVPIALIIGEDNFAKVVQVASITAKAIGAIFGGLGWIMLAPIKAALWVVGMASKALGDLAGDYGETITQVVVLMLAGIGGIVKLTVEAVQAQKWLMWGFSGILDAGKSAFNTIYSFFTFLQTANPIDGLVSSFEFLLKTIMIGILAIFALIISIGFVMRRPLDALRVFAGLIFKVFGLISNSPQLLGSLFNGVLAKVGMLIEKLEQIPALTNAIAISRDAVQAGVSRVPLVGPAIQEQLIGSESKAREAAARSRIEQLRRLYNNQFEEAKKKASQAMTSGRYETEAQGFTESTRNKIGWKTRNVTDAGTEAMRNAFSARMSTGAADGAIIEGFDTSFFGKLDDLQSMAEKVGLTGLSDQQLGEILGIDGVMTPMEKAVEIFANATGMFYDSSLGISDTLRSVNGTPHPIQLEATALNALADLVARNDPRGKDGLAYEEISEYAQIARESGRGVNLEALTNRALQSVVAAQTGVRKPEYNPAYDKDTQRIFGMVAAGVTPSVGASEEIVGQVQALRGTAKGLVEDPSGRKDKNGAQKNQGLLEALGLFALQENPNRKKITNDQIKFMKKLAARLGVQIGKNEQGEDDYSELIPFARAFGKFINSPQGEKSGVRNTRGVDELLSVFTKNSGILKESNPELVYNIGTSKSETPNTDILVEALQNPGRYLADQFADRDQAPMGSPIQGLGFESFTVEQIEEAIRAAIGNSPQLKAIRGQAQPTDAYELARQYQIKELAAQQGMLKPIEALQSMLSTKAGGTASLLPSEFLDLIVAIKEQSSGSPGNLTPPTSSSLKIETFISPDTITAIARIVQSDEFQQSLPKGTLKETYNAMNKALINNDILGSEQIVESFGETFPELTAIISKIQSIVLKDRDSELSVVGGMDEIVTAQKKFVTAPTVQNFKSLEASISNLVAELMDLGIALDNGSSEGRISGKDIAALSALSDSLEEEITSQLNSKLQIVAEQERKRAAIAAPLINLPELSDRDNSISGIKKIVHTMAAHLSDFVEAVDSNNGVKASHILEEFLEKLAKMSQVSSKQVGLTPNPKLSPTQQISAAQRTANPAIKISTEELLEEIRVSPTDAFVKLFVDSKAFRSEQAKGRGKGQGKDEVNAMITQLAVLLKSGIAKNTEDNAIFNVAETDLTQVIPETYEQLEAFGAALIDLVDEFTALGPDRANTAAYKLIKSLFPRSEVTDSGALEVRNEGDQLGAARSMLILLTSIREKLDGGVASIDQARLGRELKPGEGRRAQAERQAKLFESMYVSSLDEAISLVRDYSVGMGDEYSAISPKDAEVLVRGFIKGVIPYLNGISGVTSDLETFSGSIASTFGPRTTGSGERFSVDDRVRGLQRENRTGQERIYQRSNLFGDAVAKILARFNGVTENQDKAELMAAPSRATPVSVGSTQFNAPQGFLTRGDLLSALGNVDKRRGVAQTDVDKKGFLESQISSLMGQPQGKDQREVIKQEAIASALREGYIQALQIAKSSSDTDVQAAAQSMADMIRDGFKSFGESNVNSISEVKKNDILQLIEKAGLSDAFTHTGKTKEGIEISNAPQDIALAIATILTRRAGYSADAEAKLANGERVPPQKREKDNLGIYSRITAAETTDGPDIFNLIDTHLDTVQEGKFTLGIELSQAIKGLLLNVLPDNEIQEIVNQIKDIGTGLQRVQLKIKLPKEDEIGRFAAATELLAEKARMLFGPSAEAKVRDLSKDIEGASATFTEFVSGGYLEFIPLIAAKKRATERFYALQEQNVKAAIISTGMQSDQFEETIRAGALKGKSATPEIKIGLNKALQTLYSAKGDFEEQMELMVTEGKLTADIRDRFVQSVKDTLSLDDLNKLGTANYYSGGAIQAQEIARGLGKTAVTLFKGLYWSVKQGSAAVIAMSGKEGEKGAYEFLQNTSEILGQTAVHVSNKIFGGRKITQMLLGASQAVSEGFEVRIQAANEALEAALEASLQEYGPATSAAAREAAGSTALPLKALALAAKGIAKVASVFASLLDKVTNTADRAAASFSLQWSGALNFIPGVAVASLRFANFVVGGISQMTAEIAKETNLSPLARGAELIKMGFGSFTGAMGNVFAKISDFMTDASESAENAAQGPSKWKRLRRGLAEVTSSPLIARAKRMKERFKEQLAGRPAAEPEQAGPAPIDPSEYSRSVFHNSGEKLGNLVVSESLRIAYFLTGAFDKIQDSFGSTASSIKSAWEGVTEKIGENIGEKIGAKIVEMKEKFAPVTSGISNAIANISNEITFASLRIAVNFEEAFNKAKESFASTASSIKATWSDLTGGLLYGASLVSGALLAPFDEDVRSAVLSAFGKIDEGMGFFWSGFKTKLGGLATQALDKAPLIKAAFTASAQAVSGAWRKTADATVQGWGELASSAEQKSATIFFFWADLKKVIGDLADEALNKAPVIKFAFLTGAQAVSNAWGRTQSIVSQIWGGLVSFAGKIKTAIVNRLNHGAADVTADAWLRTEGTVIGVFNELVDAAKGAGGAIAQQFKSAVASLAAHLVTSIQAAAAGMMVSMSAFLTNLRGQVRQASVFVIKWLAKKALELTVAAFNALKNAAVSSLIYIGNKAKEAALFVVKWLAKKAIELTVAAFSQLKATVSGKLAEIAATATKVWDHLGTAALKASIKIGNWLEAAAQKATLAWNQAKLSITNSLSNFAKKAQTVGIASAIWLVEGAIDAAEAWSVTSQSLVAGFNRISQQAKASGIMAFTWLTTKGIDQAVSAWTAFKLTAINTLGNVSTKAKETGSAITTWLGTEGVAKATFAWNETKAIAADTFGHVEVMAQKAGTALVKWFGSKGIDVSSAAWKRHSAVVTNAFTRMVAKAKASSEVVKQWWATKGAGETSEAWIRVQSVASGVFNTMSRRARIAARRIQRGFKKTAGTVIGSFQGIGKAGFAIGSGLFGAGMALDGAASSLSQVGFISESSAEKISKISALLSTVGAIGAVLTPILSGIGSALLALGGVVGTVIPYVITLMTGPFAPVIAVVGAVILVLALLRNTIKSAFGIDVFAPFFSAFNAIKNFVVGAFTAAIKFAFGLLPASMQNAIFKVEAAWQGFIDRFGYKIAKILRPAQQIGERIVGFLNHGAADVTSAAWERARLFIIEQIFGLIPGAKLVANLVSGFFKKSSDDSEEHWSGVSGKVGNVFGGIAETAKTLGGHLVEFLNHRAADTVAAAWIRSHGTITGVFQSLRSNADQTGQNVAGSFNPLAKIFDLLKGASVSTKSLWFIANGGMQSVAETLKKIVSTAFAAFVALTPLQLAMVGIGLIGGGIVLGLVLGLAGIRQAIAGVIATLKGIGVFLSGLFNLVTAFIEGVVNSVRGLLTILGGIPAALRGDFSQIVAGAQVVELALKDTASKALSAFKVMGEGIQKIFSGVVQTVTGVVNSVVELGQKVKGAFTPGKKAIEPAAPAQSAQTPIPSAPVPAATQPRKGIFSRLFGGRKANEPVLTDALVPSPATAMSTSAIPAAAPSSAASAVTPSVPATSPSATPSLPSAPAPSTPIASGATASSAVTQSQPSPARPALPDFSALDGSWQKVEMLSVALSTFAPDIGEPVSAIIDMKNAFDVISDLAPGILNFIKPLFPFLISIGVALKGVILTSLAPILGTIALIVAAGLALFAMWKFNFLGLRTGVQSIINFFVLLKTAIVDEAVASVKYFFNQVRAYVGGIFDIFKGGIGVLVQPFANAFKAIFEFINKLLSGITLVGRRSRSTGGVIDAIVKLVLLPLKIALSAIFAGIKFILFPLKVLATGFAVFAGIVAPLITDVFGVIGNVITSVFELIGTALEPLWMMLKPLVSLFGLFGNKAEGVGSSFDYLAFTFKVMFTPLRAVVLVLRVILAVVNVLIDTITFLLKLVIKVVQTPMKMLLTISGFIRSVIVGAIKLVFGTVFSLFSFITSIPTKLVGLIGNALGMLWSLIPAPLRMLLGGGGTGAGGAKPFDSNTGGEPQKLAKGGFVNGIGTSTGDRIPALLSNGEFVVNARSAQEYAPLLESLNSGASDVRAVDAPMPMATAPIPQPSPAAVEWSSKRGGGATAVATAPPDCNVTINFNVQNIVLSGGSTQKDAEEFVRNTEEEIRAVIRDELDALYRYGKI